MFTRASPRCAAAPASRALTQSQARQRQPPLSGAWRDSPANALDVHVCGCSGLDLFALKGRSLFAQLEKQPTSFLHVHLFWRPHHGDHLITPTWPEELRYLKVTWAFVSSKVPIARSASTHSHSAWRIDMSSLVRNVRISSPRISVVCLRCKSGHRAPRAIWTFHWVPTLAMARLSPGGSLDAALREKNFLSSS